MSGYLQYESLCGTKASGFPLGSAASSVSLKNISEPLAFIPCFFFFPSPTCHFGNNDSNCIGLLGLFIGLAKLFCEGPPSNSPKLCIMVSAETTQLFHFGESSHRQNVGEGGWVSSRNKNRQDVVHGGRGGSVPAPDLADETRNECESKL